ncbi:MAG TPA: hypothetical protein VI078_07710 [bacterium]
MRWVPGLALLLAALLAANAAQDAWQESRESVGADFFGSWGVPRALSAGPVGNIYSEEGRQRLARALAIDNLRPATSERQRAASQNTVETGVYDTTATPFCYFLFGLCSTGDYETDYTNFTLVSLAAFTAAVFALCGALGYPAVSACLLAVLFLRWFLPFAADVHMANLGRLQCALLVAVLLVQRGRDRPVRDFVTGFLMALGILFKPSVAAAMALPVLYWSLRRRGRKVAFAAAGGTAGALIGLIGSSVYLGDARCWLEWLRALPGILDTRYGVADGNFGLAVLMERFFSVRLSTAIFLVCLLIFVAAARRSAARPGTDCAPATAAETAGPEGEWIRTAAALALGAAVMLLSAPLIWVHYYVTAIPLALVALRPAGGEPGARGTGFAAFAGISLLLFSRFLQPWLPTSGVWEASLLNLSVVLFASRALGEFGGTLAAADHRRT